MKQTTTAIKILNEMLDSGLCNENNQNEVYYYLLLAYAAGFDLGRKMHSNQKPVAQYSLDGKLIDIYESIAAANRATKVDNTDIVRCAKGAYKTAGGFNWEYVNNEDVFKRTEKSRGNSKNN